MQHLAGLHRRCRNLRQILGATFFLFGIQVFVGLQNATVTIGDGAGIRASEILNNFTFHFVFAANVFAVFLVLHLVQWVISSRLDAYVQTFSG